MGIFKAYSQNKTGLNLFVKLHPHIKKGVCFVGTDEYIIIPRSLPSVIAIISILEKFNMLTVYHKYSSYLRHEKISSVIIQFRLLGWRCLIFFKMELVVTLERWIYFSIKTLKKKIKNLSLGCSIKVRIVKCQLTNLK